jgi:hypothetical protein
VKRLLSQLIREDVDVRVGQEGAADSPIFYTVCEDILYVTHEIMCTVLRLVAVYFRCLRHNLIP